MKNRIKLFICLIILIILGMVYQFKYGNKGGIIVAFILLFSIGFGWYGYKTKQEEKENKRI